MAGSHGLWDVIAVSPPSRNAIGHLRIIQAKTGSGRLAKQDRASLQSYTGLYLVTAELWRKPIKRGQPPQIDLLWPEEDATT